MVSCASRPEQQAGRWKERTLMRINLFIVWIFSSMHSLASVRWALNNSTEEISKEGFRRSERISSARIGRPPHTRKPPSNAVALSGGFTDSHHRILLPRRASCLCNLTDSRGESKEENARSISFPIVTIMIDGKFEDVGGKLRNLFYR